MAIIRLDRKIQTQLHNSQEYLIYEKTVNLVMPPDTHPDIMQFENENELVVIGYAHEDAYRFLTVDSALQMDTRKFHIPYKLSSQLACWTLIGNKLYAITKELLSIGDLINT